MAVQQQRNIIDYQDTYYCSKGIIIYYCACGNCKFPDIATTVYGLYKN